MNTYGKVWCLFVVGLFGSLLSAHPHPDAAKSTHAYTVIHGLDIYNPIRYVVPAKEGKHLAVIDNQLKLHLFTYADNTVRRHREMTDVFEVVGVKGGFVYQKMNRHMKSYDVLYYRMATQRENLIIRYPNEESGALVANHTGDRICLVSRTDDEAEWELSRGKVSVYPFRKVETAFSFLDRSQSLYKRAMIFASSTYPSGSLLYWSNTNASIYLLVSKPSPAPENRLIKVELNGTVTTMIDEVSRGCTTFQYLPLINGFVYIYPDNNSYPCRIFKNDRLVLMQEYNIGKYYENTILEVKIIGMTPDGNKLIFQDNNISGEVGLRNTYIWDGLSERELLARIPDVVSAVEWLTDDTLLLAVNSPHLVVDEEGYCSPKIELGVLKIPRN